MVDRETPCMHKYGESKKNRITMATVRHEWDVRNFGPLDFVEQSVHSVTHSFISLQGTT